MDVENNNSANQQEVSSTDQISYPVSDNVAPKRVPPKSLISFIDFMIFANSFLLGAAILYGQILPQSVVKASIMPMLGIFFYPFLAIIFEIISIIIFIIFFFMYQTNIVRILFTLILPPFVFWLGPQMATRFPW